MSANKNNEAKDRLLLAMLPHVVFDGWSQESLAAGRCDLEQETLDTVFLFPRGMKDIAVHFGDYIDREMAAELAKIDLDEMLIRERISTSVLVRLRLLSPHKEAIRRLLSFLALPGNHPVGLQITMKTIDVIWYTAGDTAVDFNYYTKRGLLASVYGLTILYWLSDTSQDYRKTNLFLAQLINDVMQIPKLQGKIVKHIQRLSSSLNLFKRSAF
jgi:ubiquinone biosynthesis protein COQ9